MAGRPLHLVVATLTTVLAFGSAARPARAQIDSGKVGNKAVRMTPGIDAKQKLRILDSLNRTGTQDGPVAVVPARDTIFFAPSPCGDADTVQIGGRFDPVEVPDVIGMQENDAHILLSRKGLNHRSREVPLNRTTGVVFAQATPAGTRVPPGSWVRLCWAGPAEVPDVMHTTQAAAEQVLKAAGYEPAEQEGATLKTALVGKVTAQDPPAHAHADSGSTVTITVAVPTIVDVPSVVGQRA
jgi:hypothetical protein